MNINQLRKKVTALTADTAKTVEQRTEEVLSLRNELSPEDENEALKYDEVYFLLMLDMTSKANAGHEYDLEMLQLYVLLAETYMRMRNMRPMKDIITGSAQLIGNCDIPYPDIEECAIRIIEAVRYSIYNHDRYRLLAAYLRQAMNAVDAGENPDTKDITDCMHQILNLHGLLDPKTRPDLLDDALMAFISRYIKPEEIDRILKNPIDVHLKSDPVEYTLRWEEIYYDVIEELDRQFAGTHRGMGFCFQYWPAMANLLRTKYGIEWRNPHLMNPGVMFD